MTHDPLFKDVLRAFFPDFLRLFFPAVAGRLDFRGLTFLDKEAFTDQPRGRRREADLVARVRTRSGRPGLVLIHIEVEGRRRPAFFYRMFEYYVLLRLRYRCPVYPIVVYLTRGAGGLGEETYREALFDREVLTFRYGRVGLGDLSAVQYLGREHPLAAALAARMDRRGQPAWAAKLAALRRIARGRLDEARQWLLANFVETYMPLSPPEQAQFRAGMRRTENTEVRGMQMTYEDKMRARLEREIRPRLEREIRPRLAREFKAQLVTYEDKMRARLEREIRLRLAREIKAQLESQIKAPLESRIKALEKQRTQNVLDAKRNTLLRQLEEKFGTVPAAVRRRIRDGRSEATLDRWLRRLVKADSLAEMGLP